MPPPDGPVKWTFPVYAGTTFPNASTTCTVMLKATPRVTFDGARTTNEAAAAGVMLMSR